MLGSSSPATEVTIAQRRRIPPEMPVETELNGVDVLRVRPEGRFGLPIEPSSEYVYPSQGLSSVSAGKHVEICFDVLDGNLVDDGHRLSGGCRPEFGHSHVRSERQDRLAA